MTIDTLASHDPVAEEAMHPAVLRAERRLRDLEELTEIGMELVRALRPGVEATETHATDGVPAKRRDPVDQYASLSRAIRLTIALETKTDEALADLKAGHSEAREHERIVAAWRAAGSGRGPSRRDQDRCDQVRRCLKEAAEAEAETPEQLDDFYLAIEQRLAEDPAYADLEARPLRETVERLCLDVCLYPNWRRWTGEGWADGRCAPSGVNHRPRYSKFNHSSRRPIWDDDAPPGHDLE